METCEKIESPVTPVTAHSATPHNPEVVIIGAGPYGLSLAAHLKSHNVDFRIFGRPMHTWRDQMPEGMFLKSDGFASNLSDPHEEFTLKHFCAQQGIPYDDTRMPVSLSTFSAYGLAFQRRFVPQLEEKMVTSLETGPDGLFRLRIDTGENFIARTVVLAVGITHYKHIPESLSAFPEEFLTHSSSHHDLAEFRGKNVVVIGGGASAADLAALLHEGGAEVTLIARHTVRFHGAPSPKPRSLWKRMRNPGTGIGPGWKSLFFTDAPVIFHALPESLRLRAVKTHLGPAAGWFVKDKVVGRVPIVEGHTPERGETHDGKIHLTLRSSNGSTKEVVADHMIAATGYRVDLQRLGFLDHSLQKRLRTVEGAPVLSSVFESSVPGLYFLGISAANSFGPLMRFAYGADFAVRRITPRLVKRAVQRHR